MRQVYFLLTLFNLFAASCLGAGYRYAIADNGFFIHNGPAYFNRPLFGTHEPTMLLSGDRPAFAYFSPDDLGKVGTLYIGLVTGNGGKWFHEFAGIDSFYQPGLTRHILKDPLLPGASLEVTAVPLSMAEGFIIQLRWRTPPPEKVRLVWSFGGASGYRTNYSARIDKLHLSAADAQQNQVRLWGDSFSLESPTMKGRQLQGTCDLPGRLAYGDARKVTEGPVQAALAAPSPAPVAVFSGGWTATPAVTHLLFVLGGADTMRQLASRPSETFAQSVRFYRGLAKRVEVKTADPYFDLAVESMVIANDGLWQPPAFLHGAMSWMQPYLGWRGWYGTETLGYHDRVRSAIQAFASRQLQSGADRGAVPYTLTAKGVYYNMNEVFLDHVYYHYLWTGDRQFLASLLPLIEGILTWAKRRLDPDDNALYESCLNTWISDSHWYSGGDTTQSSAYLYRGYQLAAAAAEAAGKDPGPFRKEAARIRQAMSQHLWLASRGHFAEFIDRMGLRRLHPEPELPSLYLPIDLEVADEFQAFQMLRFTETGLANETGIPRGGRLVWSSNWAPNFNRQFTHSTHDLAFAEVLHLALAYYRAGQADRAYELIKGTYAGMYQGGIPGGLTCHSFRNGQQRANEEFGDSISMFLRTVVEGIFGIRPERHLGLVHLMPGLPSDWSESSIRTPDFSYRLHRSGSGIEIETTSPQPARVHYRIPIGHARLLGASIDGVIAKAALRPGIGGAFVELTGQAGVRSRLQIRLAPRKINILYPAQVAMGDRVTVRVQGVPAIELKDPQGLLSGAGLKGDSISGAVSGPPGHHTLFVRLGEADGSWWHPVALEVRPRLEITRTTPDFSTARCRFRLHNNTSEAIAEPARIAWAGRTSELPISLPAGESALFQIEGNQEELAPGKNRLEIKTMRKQETAVSDVPYWTEASGARHAKAYQTVSLDPLFNESFSTVLSRPFWTSEYPYAVCCDYMLAHMIGSRNWIPDDSRLRSRIDADGLFRTRYGIPFRQRANGNNMLALGRWRHLPGNVDIPLDGSARKIYLLLSSMTFPMQSHIANARVILDYVDGGRTSLDLVNPQNLDNGWGKFGGTYHYAEAGMEVIGEVPAGGNETVHPVARKDVILRQHGTPETFVQPEWEMQALPPHADLVDIDCDRTRKLRGLRLEVLSNEIIVGLLGVTMLR